MPASLYSDRDMICCLLQVRKTAMREVKLLQSIRHDNVICLLDVFHVRRRLYLVFEYIEGTVLQVQSRTKDGAASIVGSIFNILQRMC